MNTHAMNIGGVTSRTKKVDAIEVLNVFDHEDCMSVRAIAQQIEVYPCQDNLEEILAACKAHESSGILTSLEPRHTGSSYPVFRQT